jgi:hypothetical protein
MPLGLRVNDVLYAGNLTGADPVSGAISPDANLQLNQALGLLGGVVQRAGGKPASLRKLSIGVSRQEDAAWIMRALLELAPMATVSVAEAPLPPGQLVRLDAFAALDGGDELDAELLFLGSIPAGARIGDVLFSATPRCRWSLPSITWTACLAPHRQTGGRSCASAATCGTWTKRTC